MKTTLRLPALALALPALLALPVATPPVPEAVPVAPEVVELAVPDPTGRQVVERLSEDMTTAFSLVAVSWEGAPEQPVTASLRVRRDEQWQEWESVETAEVEGEPGTASPRGATTPLWVGEADGVQVRVDTEGAELRDLRVDLIDPGTSDADAHLQAVEPASVATADGSRPTIISRQQWGADESLRGSCSKNTRPKAAIVHHTAGSNGYTADGAAAQLRADYAYHTRSLGWCDLGYHFVVDKFGRIYEGRAGGVDAEVLGAHAGGFNTDTFGVSALGNYDEATPPSAMVQAIGRIVGWKLGRYGRDPQGTTVLTSSAGTGTTSKYPAGTQVTVPVVSGHRTVGNTVCPGQHLWAQMSTIRSVAASTAASTPVKSTSTEVKEVVSAMYADFLGRSADPSGLEHWSGLLYRGDMSQQQVALQMARSSEWTSAVVKDLYRTVLRRDPDPEGLRFWSGELAGDSRKVAVVAGLLYESQEYYARFGGATTSGWVTSLYRDILGREPDSAGLKNWTARTARDGRPVVALEFFQSPESARKRVTGLYQKLLQRQPDPSGLSTWPPVVVAQGDIALASYLAGSAEYFSRAQSR